MDRRELETELERCREKITLLEEQQRVYQENEAQLRNECNLLRGLVDSMPDYIFVKDTESHFVINNRAHLSVLGFSEQHEVLGKSDTDIFPADFAGQYLADEQQVLATDEPLINREESTVTPDGSVQWLSTTKVPLHNQAGELIGLAGVSRDITERKLAQEALAQTNQELERVAYMISQEMQEPLRTIAEHMHALEERLGDRIGNPSKAIIGSAMQAAERVQQLSEDLLAYSRMGSWGTLREPTDTHDVLSHALEHLHERIEFNQAEITYAELPTVLGDASQLLRLFRQLISNAIKYRSQEPPRIQIEAKRNEKEWVFAIRDNGIGIDAKHIASVFAPFQRFNEIQSDLSTGIGLAICRKVVENHNGRIWVESEPDRSSTFFFTLPPIPEG